MRKVWAFGGGVVIAVAAAWTAVTLSGGDGGSDWTTPSVPATATITRQVLVDTKTVDGALTYSGSQQVTGAVAGTVTWVAAEGTMIRRGRPLLKVDRRPLVLMYGELPLYRELGQGVGNGPDVEQLERNLRALGYGDSLTVDERFSYATYLAVRQWQDDLGLTRTGRVDEAQVVFLPAAVRVTEAKVQVGGRAGPGQQLLAVSGVRRLVHVDLDTGEAHQRPAHHKKGTKPRRTTDHRELRRVEFGWTVATGRMWTAHGPFLHNASVIH